MAKKKKATLPLVPVDEWLNLPPDQQAECLPCVPCTEWFALSPEERQGRAGPHLMGDPPNPQACACLPNVSGPGMWVGDGFNPQYLPVPSGPGLWYPVWDSNNGWTWGAIN